MKRTAVPAGAGDERSAERFREEKSPTLLAPGRRHLFRLFFCFLFCRKSFFFGREREKLFCPCSVPRDPKRTVFFCPKILGELFSLFSKTEISKRETTAPPTTETSLGGDDDDDDDDDDALAPFLHSFFILFF